MLKFAGAGYLVYLGARMLFDRSAAVAPAAEFSQDSDWAIYRAGFLTNLLNPKVALFFVAFLPQFVAPTAESRIRTFLFLGGLFICTSTLWCSGSRLGRFHSESPFPRGPVGERGAEACDGGRVRWARVQAGCQQVTATSPGGG